MVLFETEKGRTDFGGVGWLKRQSILGKKRLKNNNGNGI